MELRDRKRNYRISNIKNLSMTVTEYIIKVSNDFERSLNETSRDETLAVRIP